LAQADIRFSIAAGLADPIYRQLVDQVQRRVAAGQLVPGDELPSVRVLAESLAINPMTVSKAYSLLESAGVLERRRGLGMVVAAPATRPKGAARADLLRPTLERLASEAAQLGLTDDEVINEVRHALRRRP
jgi:GntR family transcriptional regulator